MGAHREIKLTEPAKSCFAYKVDTHGSEKCIALKELYCKKERCKFYKHRNTYNAESEIIK